LQIVTVGEVATQHFEELQNSDQYSEAYYFHGLAVQAAEATAVYVNNHIRRELGIPEKRGKRYSWGYPACPELADHQIVLRLLPEAVTKLGMQLTSAYQWIPEQSTAAIFAHHPSAKYYAVGSGRLEQLIAE
jgi:5-methyltetrahydrofolate--homocysteine methyltransferase